MFLARAETIKLNRKSNGKHKTKVKVRDYNRRLAPHRRTHTLTALDHLLKPKLKQLHLLNTHYNQFFRLFALMCSKLCYCSCFYYFVFFVGCFFIFYFCLFILFRPSSTEIEAKALRTKKSKLLQTMYLSSNRLHSDAHTVRICLPYHVFLLFLFLFSNNSLYYYLLSNFSRRTIKSHERTGKVEENSRNSLICSIEAL